MFYNAQHRAKKKEIPFTISMDDIIIPETCPLLGINFVSTNDKRDPRNPSKVLEMRIICVNTGHKFSEWYVRNLKHMIDTYSGLKYDIFEVIRDDKYGGVWNKLLMFDYFRDGENLYFDLDIVIKDKVPNLIRKDFTVLHAWWRPKFHTPLNSSITSWTGDQSHIFKKFKENPDYYMTKSMDQYLYECIEHKTYDKVCYSIQNREYEEEDKNYSICLFNQRKVLMEAGWPGWWKKYFAPYFPFQYQ